MIASVFALYDAAGVGVFVDSSADTLRIVAALSAKHGAGAQSLRCEIFGQPDVEMMAMLKRAWVKDLTRSNGAPPVGNADPTWADVTGFSARVTTVGSERPEAVAEKKSGRPVRARPTPHATNQNPSAAAATTPTTPTTTTATTAPGVSCATCSGISHGYADVRELRAHTLRALCARADEAGVLGRDGGPGWLRGREGSRFCRHE